MHEVEPKAFLIGETALIPDNIDEYLEYIGVPEWESDAVTDGEELIEIMGRLCYRSFKVGLNPNVTKIRERNDEYIKNIIAVRHGSVVEHVLLNFIFSDVSRVFTHELVRHRVGTAISQESLRFVRLTDIGIWIPTVFKGHLPVITEFIRLVEHSEWFQQFVSDYFKLDEPGTSFDFKKEVTSASRRGAPEGLATTIGWSANVRTLRSVIEMRTEPHAEEEIRFVFGKVAEICIQTYPQLFADYEVEIVNNLPWYKTTHSKI